MFCDG
jgi:hypothetical protein